MGEMILGSPHKTRVATEVGLEADQPKQGPDHSAKNLLPPLGRDHCSDQRARVWRADVPLLVPPKPKASAATFSGR